MAYVMVLRVDFPSTIFRISREPRGLGNHLVSFSDSSDLNLKLDATRCGGSPMHADGFAFVWAGAKAVYGIKEGKVCFEVKVRGIH